MWSRDGLPSLGRNIVTRVIHLFSFFCLWGLTYAALKFIKNEAQMGNRTFLELPAWVPELILPVTFILMTFRFGLRFLGNLSRDRNDKPLHDREKKHDPPFDSDRPAFHVSRSALFTVFSGLTLFLLFSPISTPRP